MLFHMRQLRAGWLHAGSYRCAGTASRSGSAGRRNPRAWLAAIRLPYVAKTTVLRHILYRTASH